jgi:hypothetical protein
MAGFEVATEAEIFTALSITRLEGSRLLFGGGRGGYGESNLTGSVERSSST